MYKKRITLLVFFCLHALYIFSMEDIIKKSPSQKNVKSLLHICKRFMNKTLYKNQYSRKSIIPIIEFAQKVEFKSLHFYSCDALYHKYCQKMEHSVETTLEWLNKFTLNQHSLMLLRHIIYQRRLSIFKNLLLQLNHEHFEKIEIDTSLGNYKVVGLRINSRGTFCEIAYSNGSLMRNNLKTGKYVNQVKQGDAINNVVSSRKTPCFDCNILAYDCRTKEETKIIRNVQDVMTCIATFPDKSKFVTGNSFDYNVRIWDCITGAWLHELRGHTNTINAVAVFPNNRKVISCSDDCTIKIWESYFGICLKSFNTLSAVKGVVIFPDGNNIASWSYNMVQIWDIHHGICLRVINDFDFQPWQIGYDAVAVFPDGKKIMTCSEKGIYSYNLINDEILRNQTIDEFALLEYLIKNVQHSHRIQISAQLAEHYKRLPHYVKNYFKNKITISKDG